MLWYLVSHLHSLTSAFDHFINDFHFNRIHYDALTVVEFHMATHCFVTQLCCLRIINVLGQRQDII